MKTLLFSFILLTNVILAQEKVYHFAPLPTKKLEQNIKDFIPLFDAFYQDTSKKIEYLHFKNYKDILDGFQKGTIDIAYLGPLPFVQLHKHYKFVKPIVTFKQKNSLAKYRCVIAQFSDEKLDFSKKIKVALTQPLSTCGYLMTSKLLKQVYHHSLDKQLYKYTMSHTNALSGVVEGNFDIAGAKEDIAKQFTSLGMQIIAKTELLPGFALVVNEKTLSKQEIQQLQTYILNLSEKKRNTLGGIIAKGVVKADCKDYDVLRVDMTIPSKGNM